jgi:hypothetical protein
VFYAFRHIALRIWATVLVGGLISLWILPALHSQIGLEWNLLPALGIMILVFIAIGWFSNRLGHSAVERLIREATTWERVGAYRVAEKAFGKATAVLDSFLLSPLVKRKESTQLAARLARFYLARADKNHSSEAFIISYLHSHPEDEEVAENWLQQGESQSVLKADHYELAFRIGNAQPKNKIIQHSLARFYLSEGRIDFPALQTYRQVLNGDSNAAIDIVDDLATLFLREGRADEWALRIYLQAFRLSGGRSQLLRGIAACVHWTQETERTKHLLQEARGLLASFDEVSLEKLRAGFNPPGLEPIEQKISSRFRVRIALWKVMRRMGSFLFSLIMSALLAVIARAKDLINLIKRSRRSKPILEWAMMAVLTVGVITLVVSTAGHLIRTRRALYEKEKTPEVIVTDPFTLQVAAYLKPQDAERYVKYLKTKKLDAFWIKRRGKRKIWYQVRVSHFADKASARAYGKSLKTQGIIDDFYVANYEGP